MQTLLINHHDQDNSPHWWNMAFGAGYPDWLIKSPLPSTEDGERWVWTGRKLVTLPAGLYQPWLEAHFKPISMARLQEMFRPYAEGHDSEVVRMVLKSGLFVTWPWGFQDADDTPDAIGLQSNLAATPPNPLPNIIPDDEWPGVIRMNRLEELWQNARDRGVQSGSLYDTIQALLRDHLAWLVAQPMVQVEP